MTVPRRLMFWAVLFALLVSAVTRSGSGLPFGQVPDETGQGGTPLWVGTSIVILVGLLVPLLVGPFVDMGWARWVFVAGSLSAGLGFLAMGLAGVSGVAELSQAVVAVGGGMTSYLLVAALLSKVTSYRRGAALGLVFLAGGLGSLWLTPIVNLGKNNSSVVALVFATVAMLGGVLTWFVLKSRYPQSEPSASLSSLSSLSMERDGKLRYLGRLPANYGSRIRLAEYLHHQLFRKSTILLLLAVLLAQGLTSRVFISLGILAHSTTGSASLVGLSNLAFSLLAAFSSVAWCIAADKVPGRQLFLGATVLHASALLIFLARGPFWASVLMLGIASGGIGPLLWLRLVDHFGPRMSGTVVAAVGFIQGIAASVSAPLVALTIAQFGILSTFALWALPVLAAGVLVFLAPRPDFRDSWV